MKHLSEPPLLPVAFLRSCRLWKRKSKVADSTGMDLSGGMLLMRTLILRRILLREVLAADEKFVGILLPSSVAGVVANAVMPLIGRVGVNLNYTASSEILNHCLREAGIRHVLTSRRIMEKLDLQLDAELVYLEDFKTKATLADKAVAAAQAYAMPLGMLEKARAGHAQARRPADRDIHLRFHRHAQGGNAQLSECGLQRRGH